MQSVVDAGAEGDLSLPCINIIGRTLMSPPDNVISIRICRRPRGSRSEVISKWGETAEGVKRA
jgi:hypothetical protein